MFQTLKFTARITLGYRRENVTMGIVEVYQKYFWTTLCADGFDQRDANVICRQLGYLSARVLLPGQFGRPLRYVHTVNINCIGNETDILDCEHEMGFCSTYNYASVLCSHQDASPSKSSQSRNTTSMWIFNDHWKFWILNGECMITFRYDRFHRTVWQWTSGGQSFWH